MRNLTRSAGWKLFLVFAAALLSARCGSDNGGSGNGDGEVKCNVETLTAGTYSFRLTDIDDDCNPTGIARLLDVSELISHDPYLIVLPGYQQLLGPPVQVTVTLPLVGTRTGTLSLAGEEINLSVGQVTLQDLTLTGIIGPVDMTVSVGGVLCPRQENRVTADIFVTITDTNLEGLATPCPMTFSVTGTRQGG